MNTKQLEEYIEYLKNLATITVSDITIFFENNAKVLQMLTAKQNELIAVIGYLVMFNGGELKFPKSYPDLHTGNTFGLKFEMNDEWITIKLEPVEERTDE